MNIHLKKLGLILILVAAIVGASLAFSGHGHKKVMPAKCPVCHMTLSTHWTKATPVAVQLKKNGPVYYCCNKCKMPKSALYKVPKCPVCHMTLSTHWTKMTPVAVRLTKGGPVLYCCKGCHMPAKYLVHVKKTHKK